MLSRLALKHLFCTQSTLILHHCRQVAVCLPPTDKRLDVHRYAALDVDDDAPGRSIDMTLGAP